VNLTHDYFAVGQSEIHNVSSKITQCFSPLGMLSFPPTANLACDSRSLVARISVKMTDNTCSSLVMDSDSRPPEQRSLLLRWPFLQVVRRARISRLQRLQLHYEQCLRSQHQ
jgi:hypothetical protein